MRVTESFADTDLKKVLSDRAAEACRQAEHLSKEAQRLKLVTEDAFEDAIRTVKRSAKRGLENLNDMKDESLRQVRRHPAQAVAIAVGAGLLMGLAIGWFSRRPGTASA